MSKNLLKLLVILAIVSLIIGACSTGDTTSEEPSEVEGSEPAVEPEEEVSESYYERAMTGTFTDDDVVRFDKSVAPFEEATGIDIQYQGSKEFEASISIRVDAGDAPDVVVFPQPGFLADFAADGKVIDVSTFLSDDYMKGQYNQSWIDMSMMDSPDGPIMAGVWNRFYGKSQVWYPKAAWDAAGYEIPETWGELLALSDQILADGDAPWCVGLESGAATGWPATDWMEEIMLRTTTPENYDKWTAGELPFTSPEVRNALDILSNLWKDDYVYGGQAAMATTFFGDAPNPMFEDPPKCWMHKQGNFITGFFTEGVEAGVDFDFFYLPGIDEAYGEPYLVAGDIYSMFNDRPEVRAVVELFTKGESIKAWLEAGGVGSPHNDTDPAWYGDEMAKKIGDYVKDATSVRFDGSDLMPGEVGAGSFWTGMTDYFSGNADADTVLTEIDASWPGK